MHGIKKKLIQVSGKAYSRWDRTRNAKGQEEAEVPRMKREGKDLGIHTARRLLRGLYRDLKKEEDLVLHGAAAASSRYHTTGYVQKGKNHTLY